MNEQMPEKQTETRQHPEIRPGLEVPDTNRYLTRVPDKHSHLEDIEGIIEPIRPKPDIELAPAPEIEHDDRRLTSVEALAKSISQLGSEDPRKLARDRAHGVFAGHHLTPQGVAKHTSPIEKQRLNLVGTTNEDTNSDPIPSLEAPAEYNGPVPKLVEDDDGIIEINEATDLGVSEYTGPIPTLAEDEPDNKYTTTVETYDPSANGEITIGQQRRMRR